MYIILSHPAYNRPRFKVFSVIPPDLRRYVPEVLTQKLELKPINSISPDERWVGNRTAAHGMVTYCLGLGGNPIIVQADRADECLPQPTTQTRLNKKQTLFAYEEILKKIALNDEFVDLYIKVAKHVVDGKTPMELTKKEIKQLLGVLRIFQLEEPEPEPESPPQPDSDVPPKNVPLFDMSQYSEEPEEPPMLDFVPSEMILHGQTKGDALRLNRTRRRKV